MSTFGESQEQRRSRLQRKLHDSEQALDRIIDLLKREHGMPSLQIRQHLGVHSNAVTGALELGRERGLIHREQIAKTKQTRYSYTLADPDRVIAPYAPVSEPLLPVDAKNSRRRSADDLIARRHRGEVIAMQCIATVTGLPVPTIAQVVSFLEEGLTLTDCRVKAKISAQAVRTIAACMGWTLDMRARQKTPQALSKQSSHSSPQPHVRDFRPGASDEIG